MIKRYLQENVSVQGLLVARRGCGRKHVARNLRLLRHQPQGSGKVIWSCSGLSQVFAGKRKVAGKNKEGKERAFQAEGRT